VCNDQRYRFRIGQQGLICLSKSSAARDGASHATDWGMKLASYAPACGIAACTSLSLACFGN
jgi:hypothetical protein